MTNPDHYTLSADPARLQLDRVWAMLRGAYWCKDIRRDVVERAFTHSLWIGAFHTATGEQVGVARLVTDRATFAWLCDVFVHENHRGRGLSKRMVQTLLEHPDVNTLRRFLLATADAHTLYQRFGFAPIPEGRFLELKPDPTRWQNPPADTH